VHGLNGGLSQRISAAKEGDNMNYQIQGLSIHAEVHGTAEPALVFLHYWGGASRTWRKVTAELEGQFKTVAYDARGWGKSDKASAGYKMADLADEALSLVKALGIKQYVMVGHSMGGKVAQLAASRRPEGLLGLVLVAPAQPTPRRNPEEMREGQLHAYDNRENVLKTIGSGRLTARPPSPEILEQIVARCGDFFEIGQRYCDDECSRSQRQREYWESSGKEARRKRLSAESKRRSVKLPRQRSPKQTRQS
jgi:pimeloyl-ACP methyl ester carboxylesterase